MSTTTLPPEVSGLMPQGDHPFNRMLVQKSSGYVILAKSSIDSFHPLKHSNNKQ